jgi:hypothetical protein
MTDTAGAVAVAAARRGERRIVHALRDQGATSQDRAASLVAHRPGGRMALKRLIRGGAVREIDDRYWLDEAAYAAMREARRMRVVFALVVVALIVVATLVLTLVRTWA